MTYFSDEPQTQWETPKKSRARRFFGGLLIGTFVVGAIAAVTLPSPYVIERPGPAFNVLGDSNNVPVITVSGAKSYPTEGSLDLLTVNLLGNPQQTPTWFELAGAAMDPSQNIVPLDEVFPPTATTQQVDKQNALMFQDSQQQATAVALKALGYRYDKITYVADFGTVSPAKKVLKTNDVLTTIDGKKVTGILGVRALVQAAKGKAVTVAYERNGTTATVQIKPFYDKVAKSYRLGVYVGTHYKFPIDVTLQLQDVGGPSGGTMFALGIYDKLTPGSLTGGQLISGTGTIDESGKVGIIGGIRQKMYGAVRSGATWFLAPKGNCNEVVGHVPTGLTVVSVSTFNDALEAVKQIAAKQSAAGLPTCTK